MGPDRTPRQPPSGAAAATCPACGSVDPAIAFATQTTTYLLCRTCEHMWQTGERVTDETWTSLAFRITRRKLTPPRH
jgi:hypothetical protein